MFKKITLSFLAFLLISNLSAQFSIHDTVLVADGYVGASTNDYIDLFAHTKIYNKKNQKDTFVWNRNVNNLPTANWTSAVCDIIQCHGVTVNNAEFILNANDSGDLSFHFYPKTDKGNGNMTVRFSSKSNASNFIDVKISSQAWGLSVNQITLQSHIYPNPSNNTVTVNSNNIATGTLTVYNHLGQMVESLPFADGMNLDVSSYNKGFYFIELSNENNKELTKLLVD